MKKVALGLFAFALANFCHAQTTAKKEDVKFTPPIIKKNKPASVTKFTPPVIWKDKGTSRTHTVTYKSGAAKKRENVKFTPPVIVKD
ncbi:hypothetical protein [Flavisolibacter nicotianae]|uniref:hypothetical protein n=1 Tax=Flavisolibacter nicotianae TaxID=2364882 RepID=UPI0013C4060B|nr:hypothetical protein [Flavisolibacter nicotianae]